MTTPADRLDAALRDVFGLESFRPGQRMVVEAVLAGRPTVAVMPTGAGKSLCYQLPAVVAGGTALVVSPLIALMKDQVDALTARGVPACALTSALAPGELTERLEDVAAGRYRLVYVAPERFRSPRFEEAMGRVAARLSLVAIDEAHCISEWGHDFRPDYLRLGEVVSRWAPPRLVALTATATPEVRRDIVRQLGMADPAVFVRGFDRPNLRFAVERIGGAEAKAARVAELVAERGAPALVYAATRKNAEAIADDLRGRRVRARPYHAGLDDATRARVQDEFMAGAVDVVVATNAFGMGIDKADVRLVVHADLPRSPEAYYQEAGRAGRDGGPAECVLLFNHGDVRLQEFLIDASSPSVELLRAMWRAIRSDPRLGASEAALRRALPGAPGEGAVSTAARFLVRAGYLRERDGVLEAIHPGDPGTPAPAPLDAAALAARAEVERSKLRAMVDYAYTTGCRRAFVLAYFGDEDARLGGCHSCDACDGEGRRALDELDEDDRRRVETALRLVERLRGRFGRAKLAALLAGDEDDERFAELPERGALRAEGARWSLDLLRALEGAGLLAVSTGEYPTVGLTPAGRRAADGHTTGLALALPPPPARGRGRKRGAGSPRGVADARKGAGAGAPADPALIERLRRVRRELASREAVPPYVVFPDRTLEEIARACPGDLDALAALHGIGASRLDRYGAAILAAVRGETAA